MTMFNSIRIKLTIWYLSILALIIIGFALVIYLLVAHNLNQTTNKNLSSMSENVADELFAEEKDLAVELKQASNGENEDEADEKTPTIEEAIIEEISDLKFIGYQFVVFDKNNAKLVSTIADQTVQDKLLDISAVQTFADIPGKTEVFRLHQTTLTLNNKKFRLLVGHPLAEQTEFLTFLKKTFYLAIPIALLLAGLGGYFLAKRSLIPVIAMSRQAANIGSTNLNERLPIKNETDELGSLAKVFNALLARLENSFDQQQRFMADASHELRTPLAIIRTESEVAISKDTRKAESYKESLAIVHNESKRLTNIVEDLFLLARADRGQVEPHKENVYLDEIITESVRSVRTLAEKRNIKVNFAELPAMPLRADESLLHRLFLNLIDNAIKYNREAGTISIDAKEIGTKYQITISDTGIGISPEKQAKIFDRFYRADDARSRVEDKISGGAGLGLSIAKWIAKIHKGTLTLERSDETGSTFKLELKR